MIWFAASSSAEALGSYIFRILQSSRRCVSRLSAVPLPTAKGTHFGKGFSSSEHGPRRSHTRMLRLPYRRRRFPQPALLRIPLPPSSLILFRCRAWQSFPPSPNYFSTMTLCLPSNRGAHPSHRRSPPMWQKSGSGCLPTSLIRGLDQPSSELRICCIIFRRPGTATLLSAFDIGGDFKLMS